VRGWLPRLAGINDALAVAAGGGAIWVTVAQGLIRVEPTTPGRSTVVRTSGAPYDVAVEDGRVWAAGAGFTGWEVDARSGRASQFELEDSREHSVATDRSNAWVANFRTGVVERIDLESARVTGHVKTPGGIAAAIATGFGEVWVIDGLAGALDRIDVRSLKITGTVDLPGNATAVATGAGRVWVAEDRRGALLEIDPGTLSIVRTLSVGRDAPDLAVGFGAVWITHRNGTLTRFDLPRGSAESIDVTNAPGPLAAVAVDEDSGSLWVTACPPGLACGLVGDRAGGHAQ
jgi:DNA-binding beta-propeller fold protein YncE